MTKSQEFFDSLIPWYLANRRTLPWRENRTPYRVWISEIMLQQTQVVTVIAYFNRWMALWPTLADLATSSEQAVLKAWEGLGYYSRARNILKTARQLHSAGLAELPTSHAELLKLPGIGQYTAAAIASLAGAESVPAVDGNVLRVISRHEALPWQRGNESGLKACRELLSTWMAELKDNANWHPGLFNEAVIELGALVCQARNPQCPSCPLAESCLAYQEGDPLAYPLPSAKTKRSIEYYTVLILKDTATGLIAATQRPDSGLLASLWQFPLIEGWRSTEEIENYLDDLGYRTHALEPVGNRRHVFSHLTWELHLAKAEVSFDALGLEESASPYLDDSWHWLGQNELQDLPFSAALQDVRDNLAMMF